MGPGGAPPGAGGSGAALGPEAAGPERGERECGHGGVGMSRPPATGKMPGAPEDLLGDGAGAISDKGLKGLGAPGRCDKAADGRVSCGAPPRLEAPARPPGTGAGDQAGVRGGASGSVTPAFLPSQSR